MDILETYRHKGFKAVYIIVSLNDKTGYHSGSLLRYRFQPGAILTVGAFTINTKVYEAAGSPSMKTLDEYKAALQVIKDKNPDIKFLIIDQMPDQPQESQHNMVQMINRAYGGTDTKHIMPDGTVHFNFRDAEYLKAVKYVNDLYRSKLFNPETLTFNLSSTQWDQALQNKKVFSAYGQSWNMYHYDMTETGEYLAFEPPQAPGVTMKIKNIATGIADVGCVLTKNCKNPERAIKYLEFCQSDEGQMLFYHGIEGVTYTIEEGMPKRAPEVEAAWNKDFAAMQQTYGILGPYQMVNSNWTDEQYYYWMFKTNKFYSTTSAINDKYAYPERLEDLTQVDASSSEKIIETKLYELWKTSYPKMILAKSEAECQAAYDTFIKQADSLGAPAVEKALTADYTTWQQKLK